MAGGNSFTCLTVIIFLPQECGTAEQGHTSVLIAGPLEQIYGGHEWPGVLHLL